MFVSDKRLYLNDDGQVVEHLSEGSGTLLVGAGGTLDSATAIKHGLITDPNAEAKETQPEGKAIENAPENKAVQRPAGKGKGKGKGDKAPETEKTE